MATPVVTLAGLSIPIEVKGKFVAVQISSKALQKHFGADEPNTWIDAYLQNSGTIDAKAKQRIAANPTIEAFLGSGDF